MVLRGNEMFYKSLDEIGSNLHTAIASLYNIPIYIIGTDEEFFYNKKHLGISYMYLFTNIHTLDKCNHWFDIYDKNQLIKTISNETNSIELIDRTFKCIIKNYKEEMNYLVNVYEINEGKEYINIFSLIEMKHTRIEINEDLTEELRSMKMSERYEVLLRQENIKNIHKDIKYIIKKHRFKTINIATEILQLII